jgi:hypothetical protein
MEYPLYQRFAYLVEARLNCIKLGNTEWKFKHEDRAEYLVRNHMPSGAGIDNGTTLDFDKSTPEKLVFHTAYHHMDENGYYDGWTHHTVVVKPSLTSRFYMTISGRDRNGIKDYLHDCFCEALNETIPQS